MTSMDKVTFLFEIHLSLFSEIFQTERGGREGGVRERDMGEDEKEREVGGREIWERMRKR